MALEMKLIIEVDCLDKTCLNFTDATGAYNDPANLGGYGGPNLPSIEDIDYTVFKIVFEAQEYYSSVNTYKPNAAGNNTVCLPVSSFTKLSGDVLELSPGQQFELYYAVYDNEGNEYQVIDTATYPCCGEQISTDLGVSFAIQENTGFTSLTFTDTTGTYNATTNPGGYGTPNPGYDDIENTLITITLADGKVVNIYTFVPTALNQSTTITNQQLGYGDGQILPQVINVEYYIYTTADCQIASANGDVLIHGPLSECIVNRGKAVLTAQSNACCDGDAATNRTLGLIFRYEAMIVAATKAISCVAQEVQDLYEDCKQDCPDCE